jgi:hypothetical protein
VSFDIIMRGVRASAKAAGSGDIPKPDALLGAEVYFETDDGPVIDGSSRIQAWANLGTLGGADDRTQGTAAERLIYNASDPDFDGHPSAEGDTTRWMPGIATTAFNLPDDGSVEMLMFCLHDPINSLSACMGTMSLGAGYEFRVHTVNATIRGETQDDASGLSASLGPASSITAGVPFIGRYQLIGAASPSNDAARMFVDGVGGTADNDPLTAISPGHSPALASRAPTGLSSGMNGKFTIGAAKIGGWSGAELVEIYDYIALKFPSYAGGGA